MRIRQVRPEFFTDPVMASLTPSIRLTYIGLWCVADDAGWLRWDVPQIGAQLWSYETPKRREREMAVALDTLSAAGRVVLHPCGCLHIPHLVDHQRVGGVKNTMALERHRLHINMDQSSSNGRVGNVSNGRGGTGGIETKDGSPSLKQRLGDYPELLKVVR